MEACGDGGDCLDADYPGCAAADLSLIRYGECNNYNLLNTEACGYDGGECDEFNAKYPGCAAHILFWIVDDICDYAPYNTTEACGYGGGDCL